MTSARPPLLLLGGAGFIGAALRRHLAPRYRILTVDLREQHPLSADEVCLVFDQGDPEQVRELEAALAPWAGQVVAAVHLTAYYDFRDAPNPRYTRLESTFPALLGALDRLLVAGGPILHSSSMAAMAPTEPGVLQTSASPRAGGWAYPHHKRVMEDLLEAAVPSRPRGELVLAGVYSDRCELVPLFQQIDRIRRRSLEAFFYPGPTDRGLTYVHLDDVVAAFTAAAERLAGQPGVHRLLIGEPAPVTYRMIHDQASLALHGRRLPLAWVPKGLAWAGAGTLGWLADRIGHRRFIRPWMLRYAGEHFEFDLTEASRVLGWQPRHRLPDRLPRILDFARVHTDLWLSANGLRPW